MILLGTCTRLNARITERQCQINQGIPHLPCRGCSGLENTASSDYQPPVITADTNNTSDTSTPQKEDTMSNKRITCKTCKRKNMVLAAAGECGRCYGRRKAGKDPLTNEPVIAVASAEEASCKDNAELLSIQKPSERPPQEPALEQPQGKPARKVAPRVYPTPEEIRIPFITLRDADLFVKLQSLADAHRRTIEAEIMFQLEDRVMQIENIYLSILDK